MENDREMPNIFGTLFIAIVAVALVGVLGLVSWGTLWVWSQVF